MGRGETVASAVDRVRPGGRPGPCPRPGAACSSSATTASARPGHGAHDPALWSATQDELRPRSCASVERCAEVVSGDELPAALAAASRAPRRADLRRRLPRQLRRWPIRSCAPTGCRRCSSSPPASSTARASPGGTRSPGWCARSRRAELAPGPWLDAPAAAATGRPRRGGPRARRRLRAPRPAEHRAVPGVARPGVGRRARRPALAASTWMTWDMVREMRRGGMAFGAHTVDHPVLARCSADAPAARDRRVGRPAPRGARARPPTLFSYPDRRAPARSTRARAPAAREAGITHAFSLYGGLPAPGPPRPARHPADVREPGALARRASARPSTLPRGLLPRPAPATAAASPPPRRARPPRRRWAGAGCVRRGIVWSVAAFGASKALSLLSILVLARLLTPDQFGVVAAVAAYIALIELGSDLGHEARRSSTSRRRASASASRPRSP